ncbi:hypothetical protein [Streptomyces sp. NPDC050388]|uniref:hypothetical protein n=1 Tax=Streptomyces sp. NPDC050388 TaxID=3155781 RepID=UPI0034148BF9
MLVDQGVFGPGPWELPEAPGTAPAPADTVGLHAQAATLERIRAADELAPEDESPDGHPAAYTNLVCAVRPVPEQCRGCGGWWRPGRIGHAPHRVVYADGGSR